MFYKQGPGISLGSSRALRTLQVGYSSNNLFINLRVNHD